MHDYMTPHGLVIKLNAEKSGAVSDEEVRDNVEFRDWITKRLLSCPKFAKRRAERWRRTADGELDPDHRMGVRAFARLHLTHAKLYARQAKNPIAFARAHLRFSPSLLCNGNNQNNFQKQLSPTDTP